MLSRIEIKEELERFIEWPTDDHGSVSATSTALFAHHVQQKATEKLRAELERVTAELEQYKRDSELYRHHLNNVRIAADNILSAIESDCISEIAEYCAVIHHSTREQQAEGE